ncbi:MAG: response regulator [Flavobacteriia bacterium]|nr:response regulator [Flavobacteriia bacterium]OJX39851.1 MAG: two-component system response regulator [Flavobacteriia bacterium 40-80]
MSTKLKCLLLDDELPGLTYLKMLCEQIPDLEVVKSFNNPVVFLNEIPSLEFDLCIMDIEMPEMNGLQVANLISGKPVIFTTAYKEHAAEAFDIDAIDYVRKPVKKERLQQAIEKAKLRLNQHRPEKKFIQINTDKGKAVIFFEQLAYIKASEIDSRDKVAHLIDGSTIVLKNISFKSLKAMLPTEDFVRINKKEVIALKIVKLFSFDEITTTISTDGKTPLKLSLGEVYREVFLQRVRTV